MVWVNVQVILALNNVYIIYLIRVLELVDSLNLSLSDASRKRSNRFSDRGYSLTGKTAILHIVISGSSPDNSIVLAWEAQLVERITEDD